MASLIYNSALEDMARGAIDFDTDSFKAMLVTSAYVPSKDADLKRSAVTNEVIGTGYTAGGLACSCTVTKDVATDKVILQFAAVSWPASTITARGLVIYKSRNGASSLDELIAYNDFGSNVSSIEGSLNVAASSVTLQN